MKTLLKRIPLIILATQLTFCGDSAENQKDEAADETNVTETVKSATKSTKATRKKQPQAKKSPPASTKATEMSVSFTDYCNNPKPLAESQTILTLLEVTESQTCEELDQTLTGKAQLSLQDKKLASLEPLRFFPNLQYLNLQNTGITDIEPLQDLTNLVFLNLSGNQISKIDGLNKLTGLRYLYVNGNPANNADQIDLPLFAFKASDEPAVRLQPHQVGEREKAEKYLLSGANMCTGRWDYAPFKTCAHKSHGVASYKSKSSKACGVAKVNEIPKTCRHIDHGLEDGKPIKSGSTGLSKRSCESLVQWLQVSLSNKYPPTEYLIEIHSQYRKPLHELLCAANWFVKGYKVKTSKSCGITKQPVYKSCRHASHGVESYHKKATAVCGTSAPVLSAMQQLRNSIASKGVPSGCTTCSNLPVHDQGTANQKFECLWSNFQKKDLLDPERVEIITALKLLAKSYAHFLKAAQVEQVLMLHQQFPKVAYDVESNLGD